MHQNNALLCHLFNAGKKVLQHWSNVESLPTSKSSFHHTKQYTYNDSKLHTFEFGVSFAAVKRWLRLYLRNVGHCSKYCTHVIINARYLQFFKNILYKLLCNDHLRIKVFIFVDPENRKPSCIYLFSYSIILLAVVRMWINIYRFYVERCCLDRDISWFV